MIFRLAILSDLHAYSPTSLDEGESEPSYLNIRTSEVEVHRHPLMSLLDRIQRDAIRADVVLCAGDIGDKADPEALRYCWAKMHDVRGALGAEHLIATAGNHDMDSRAKNDFDARGALQGLVPPFPYEDERVWDRYWSRHFAAIEGDEWRVVTLNSAAHHGYRDEYEHGRFSDATQARLREYLETNARKSVNILLCHHHPVEITVTDEADASRMQGGAALLEMLDERQFGRWLVIHGHKHYPAIVYQSGAQAPTVFSAASFAAYPYPGLKAGNQFYVMEFDTDEIRRLRLGLAGRVEAWDWVPDEGWERASGRDGLPARGGFGLQEQAERIAVRVVEHYEESTEPYLTWGELLAGMPELQYLLPGDLRVLKEVLRDDHDLDIVGADGGYHIGRVRS